MRHALSGRLRTHLGTTAALSALALAGPAYAPAATVTVEGADARTVVDCRNVADDGDSERQRNRCKAQAEGGEVSLKHVDIHFVRGTRGLQVNGGAVDALTVGGGNAEAGALCVNEFGEVVPGRQISLCRARARGGRVAFRRVHVEVHRRDGTREIRRRDLVFDALDARPAHGHAVCIGRGNSEAECQAGASGGNVQMRNVDMVDRVANTTRTNIDISVTGGDASALVSCANSAAGGGVQVNRCSSSAEGGDVLLADVRFHVYES